VLVPAGSPVQARSSGHRDELHIFLEAGVVERVAAEAFDRDPARLTIPPFDSLDLPLVQLAAAAHRSAYHFARQFTAATGVPPHQYVIARRVARAQELLHPDRDLALAEIAARVGFSDQSQFSHHFKRLVGVTPRQFLLSARTALGGTQRG
jgi:AraC-like DNA-binding protein